MQRVLELPGRAHVGGVHRAVVAAHEVHEAEGERLDAVDGGDLEASCSAPCVSISTCTGTRRLILCFFATAST
jgi:hypothetical protein